MNNERDDALTSVHCPQCHAVTAVPASPVPPMTNSNESALDRIKGSEPGDTNGIFNACPECGMLWAGAAASLKDAARDEPTGEHARQATFRGIGWLLIVAGVIATAWCAYAAVPIGIVAGVILIVAGMAMLSFANKQEHGSKRASGIAGD